MREKLRSLIILSLLLSLVCDRSIRASFNREEDVKAAVKVKSTPVKPDPDAQVEIKSLDKTKLKGYLSQLNDDHFMAAEGRTAAVARIAFTQIQKVKARNHLTGDTILAIVIVVGLLVAVGGQVIAHHGDF